MPDISLRPPQAGADEYIREIYLAITQLSAQINQLIAITIELSNRLTKGGL